VREFLARDAILVGVEMVRVGWVLVEHGLRVLLELKVSAVEILGGCGWRHNKQQRARSHRRQ